MRNDGCEFNQKFWFAREFVHFFISSSRAHTANFVVENPAVCHFVV